MVRAATVLPLGIHLYAERQKHRPESGRDKKDAEALKTASSPYKRTAETVFGGRKSENIFHLLEESVRIPTLFSKSGCTKAAIKKLVFAFSVCAFLADP